MVVVQLRDVVTEQSMITEVRVPEAGESVTEGVIVEWYKADGALVAAEEALFELETDKVTMSVPAEHAGRLAIRVPAGSRVAVGQVVATIDTEAGATDQAPKAPAASAKVPGPPLSPPAGLPQVHAKIAAAASLEELSPAVRRVVVENQLDPAGIPATGKAGRLTKEDVVRFLEASPRPTVAAASPPPAEPAPAPPPAPRAAPAAVEPPAAPRPAAPAPLPGARQTRKPMSTLRQRIAERLVQAQHTAAILTTFNEVDMSAVNDLRKRVGEDFEKRHGVRLGMMSFFVKAVVDALQTVPAVNAQIEGDEIVTNHYYDIGVAVSTEAGLVVPVLRDADRLSFAEIERTIGGFATRARERKLTLADLTGGVFTVSNGGVFGSLVSTPILNPPQSGILGLHAVKKRPVVVNDQIVIRPMMYLAFSYDHRLVDGREAVTFLKRIVTCIENPERMLLGV